MSEVQRYEWSAKGMRIHAQPMGRYVQASDYDATQSELSALREELAECITEMTLALTDYETRRAMTTVGRTRFMEILQKYNAKINESEASK